MSPSDISLLERWQGGRDAKAFQELVSRHGGMVYGASSRILRNAADAEEVAQECFLALAQAKAGNLRLLGGWLHTLATHRSLDRVRADKRRKQRERRYAEAAAANAEPTWNEIQHLVDEAIATLPEELSCVVVGHFLEGRSQADLAQSMDLSPSAISRRIDRAVEQIRESLRKRGAIIGAGILPGMLAEAASATVPKSLAAALGKLALSGAGGVKPAAVSTIAAGLLTPIAVKSGLAVLALVTVAGLGFVLANQPPSATTSSPAELALEPMESLPIASPPQEQSPVEEQSLAKESSGAEDGSRQYAGPVRVLHFPEDSKLGHLFVLERWGRYTYRIGREPDYDRWTYLCEARGDVTVPADRPLKLQVGAGGLSDAHLLSSLGPKDLHTLSFDLLYADTDDAYLRHIQGLTGLVDLSVGGPHVTERGLQYIGKLKSLEKLFFWSSSLPDTALANLQDLKSLRALTIEAPIGDEGLQYLSALTSLRELSLRGRNIEGPGLAYLARIPSLEFLELRGGGPGNERGGPHNRALKYLEGLTSLKKLLLHFCRNLTNTGMLYLANIEHLEALVFIGPYEGITDGGMLQLGNLHSLLELDLGGTRVTDRGLRHLRSLQNLERLGLPASRRIGAGVSTVTDAALAYVAELPKLRHLNVGGYMHADSVDPGPFTDEGLKSLTRLDRLESLSIVSGTAVTDAGMAHIARLSRLESLFVGANGITNEGVAHLAKLKSLRDLQLSFPYTDNVTVAGVNHLNALRRLRMLHIQGVVQDDVGLDLGSLTKLEHLYIMISLPHSNRIVQAYRDEDLESFSNLTRLKFLSLGTSPLLTDAGLAHIASIDHLERLIVGGENVTDQGLAQVAKLQYLRQLHIEGNFTDEGLCQLETLRGLTNLTVHATQGVSDDAKARIRASLPNLFESRMRQMFN